MVGTYNIAALLTTLARENGASVSTIIFYSLMFAACAGSPPAVNTSPLPRYVIKIREFAKFVVGLGEKVSATDIEESMRVGVDTSHGGKQLGLWGYAQEENQVVIWCH